MQIIRFLLTALLFTGLLAGCSYSSTDVYWNSAGCAFVGTRSISSPEVSRALNVNKPYGDTNAADSFDISRKVWYDSETYDVSMRRLPNYDKPGCKTLP